MSDPNSFEVLSLQTRFNQLRAELVECDEEFIRVIARRREVAREIGAVKKALNLPAYVPEQHDAVRARVRSDALEHRIDPSLATASHDPLLADSVRIQDSVLGTRTFIPQQDSLFIVE